ncbi:hypothetical protein BCR36DRAFT_338995, partial [Piromyces finnis]
MDVDTNWCLYCGKKTEGNLYCSKYCHNLDKNKNQKFYSEHNSKIQNVCSEIITPSYDSQYSLKFKNRISSYNPSLTRKRNNQMNNYNPYWMISNGIVDNITNTNIKNRKSLSINIPNELENGNIERVNKNYSKDLLNSKIISESPKSAQTLIYSSFENPLNDEAITNNNKMKNLFSLFYNNSKDNVNTTINNKTNNNYIKRNESLLNLNNGYQHTTNTKPSSFSSSSSSIYSSNYNNNEKINTNYNKVIVINSSSNNQHIKKGINRMTGNSNFDATPKSLDGSSLIDTSMTQLSSVTEVSSITISSETMNSYGNKGKKIQSRSRSLTERKYSRNNNFKLKFKNLYLSKKISHKVSLKNIEYFNNHRKQSRRSCDSVFTSSDEYPATLYSFRQINTRFPKQFRKKSMENYKIHMFKDSSRINKDARKTMKRIHHKKNVSDRDYIYAIECLNAITTNQDTIKSVKKSGELIEGLKNKGVNHTNHSFRSNKQVEQDNGFSSDASYNYPSRDVYDNDVNQFISNNKVNYQYERDFIHGNLKANYPYENKNNYESPQQHSDHLESSDLEKQKQDLQQLLIQQIQQQSRYYQENKIDYSYSCTTLSSYSSDESYYDSDFDYDYSIPDMTRPYYETVTIASNPASSITSISFRKHRNDSLSVQASLSSFANNDLKKLTSLCNNINSTLEQIKIINEELETHSNSSKFDLTEEEVSSNSKALEKKSIQLKHGEQLPPIFHNNTLMLTPDIHNTNFKFYNSEITESVTSSTSSTISTDSIKDTNYLYYKKSF